MGCHENVHRLAVPIDTYLPIADSVSRTIAQPLASNNTTAMKLVSATI